MSTDMPIRLSPEEFVAAARHFAKLSDKFHDRWTLHDNDNEILNTYVRKEEFINHRDENNKIFLYRAEYIIFFNLSYGVPSLSFNVWDCSGKLLTLEEVRQLSLMKMSMKDFYSVVTQQEHPVMHRPYFIIHPCHTADLIAAFRHRTKNLIITFLASHCTKQGRRREPCVKTLRSPLSDEFWRHCMLSGRTQQFYIIIINEKSYFKYVIIATI